jgi:hypothetical protein
MRRQSKERDNIIVIAAVLGVIHTAINTDNRRGDDDGRGEFPD